MDPDDGGPGGNLGVDLGADIDVPENVPEAGVLPTSGSTTTSAAAAAAAAAPGGVDDDDDDFESPVEFETATAKANRLLADENKIPKLHLKDNWAELPSKLSVDAKFDSRVDCESIAMAYAESIGMLLDKKREECYRSSLWVLRMQGVQAELSRQGSPP